MERTVIIDCFPESAAFYRHGYAIVTVDVIRATTMAITAVTLGRRCFPVTTVEQAFKLAGRLDHPILAGELAGDMPAGFDMNNSPAELVLRTDTHRPIILLSSSGTQLIHRARGADAVYLSCFRNFSATARHICTHHSTVAVIGAGSRREFREEDQMCCAWVGEMLIEAGYHAGDQNTLDIVHRWKGAPASACSIGNSANYLRRTGQVRDLDFILASVDDLDAVYTLRGQEIVVIPKERHIINLPGSIPSLSPDVYDIT
jgi:2-phosphosulfolactate phosphatase